MRAQIIYRPSVFILELGLYVLLAFGRKMDRVGNQSSSKASSWPTSADVDEFFGLRGDMYAGLNDEEREALLEVTRFGFPPRAWFNFQKIAFGYTGVFTALVDRIVDGDPTYFEDFWSKPGYLGFNPLESLKKARIQHPTKIAALVMPDEARKMGLPLTMPTAQTQSGVNFPAALKIAGLPQGNLQGASIIVKSGGAQGHIFYIAGVVGDY